MAAVVYNAKERGSTSIPLAEIFQGGEIDLYPEVVGREYFDIRFRRDKLHVTAGKYIGLIALNSRVYVQVEPKIPVANILALLTAGGGDIVELSSLEREYRSTHSQSPQVLAALANALVAALQRIETEGLAKEYCQVDRDASILKGQIQFKDSLTNHWSRGRLHMARSRYFDLTSDTFDNQLILAALHSLLRRHRASGALAPAAPALGHFAELFERSGVSLPRDIGDHRSPVLPNRNRTHYRKALRVSRLILGGFGVELTAEGSDVSLPSFLVDMETLFESYVRSVVTRSLSGFTVLDGNKGGAKPLFDDRATPAANPDVVVRSSSGECAVVIEVKYKTSETRDDLNQVLAYALSYRTRNAVLVLPANSGSEPKLETIGSVDGVRVFRYRLDLGTDDLGSEEQTMVSSLRGIPETQTVTLPA